MKTWPIFLWIVLLIVIVFILGSAGYLFYLYAHAGLWWQYLALTVGITLFFTLPTIIFKKTHTLHMHHYTVGMILVAIIGY